MAEISVNMKLPVQKTYVHTNADGSKERFKLHQVRPSTAKGKAKMVYVQTAAKKKPTLVHFGTTDGENSGYSEESWKVWMSRFLPKRDKDGNVIVNDPTSGAYWSLRVFWKNRTYLKKK